MKTNTRINLFATGVSALTAVLLAVVLHLFFHSVPQLSSFVDPTLVVRKTTTHTDKTQLDSQLQVGDRVVAIDGYSVFELSGLKQLANAIFHSKDSSQRQLVNLLVLRDRHRIHLDLSKHEDPSDVLKRVNATDRVIAIDGRVLPNPMGIEAIRDIAASRNTGVITVLRKNQLLNVQIPLLPPSYSATTYWGFLAFFMALLIWIAWFSAGRTSPDVWLLFHTELVIWGGLFWLFSNYQWLIAEPLAAFAGMVALTLIRPLGLFTKQFVDRRQHEDPGTRGFGAVALGLGGVGLITVLWFLGVLKVTNSLLYLGAMFGGLYIIYEIFLVGFRVMNAGEKLNLYLVGLLVLALLTGFTAWYVEPFRFSYADWRWFVFGIAGIALINDGFALFGDVSGQSTSDALVETEDRGELIDSYLQRVETHAPQLDFVFVFRRPTGVASRALKRSESGSEPFVETATPDDVGELLSILEGVGEVIPKLESEGDSSPSGHYMSVAKSLGVELAYPLRHAESYPARCDIWLLGIGSETPDSSPHYVDPDIFSTISEHFSSHIELSVLLEIMLGSAPSKEFISEFGGQTHLSPSTQSPSRSPVVTEAPPPPSQFEQLLEDELLEAIEYLSEDSSPIVLVGRYRSGKAFAARCANALESDAPLLSVSATEWLKRDTSASFTDFLSECEAKQPEQSKRSILVRSVGELGDETLLDLTTWSKANGRRLFFSFNVTAPEEVSPLEARGSQIEAELGRRELIIPRLGRRTHIIEDVATYFVKEAEKRHASSVSSISEEALSRLKNHDFPAGFSELRLRIDRCVKELDSETVIEPHHLGFTSPDSDS
jgi:hypothetical protein